MSDENPSREDKDGKFGEMTMLYRVRKTLAESVVGHILLQEDVSTPMNMRGQEEHGEGGAMKEATAHHPQSSLFTIRGTFGPSCPSSFGRCKMPLWLPILVSIPSGNSNAKFRIKTESVA